MNGITILEGDCRETLKTLPAESVHCVVTSPPYFGLRDYGCDGQIGLEASPAEFVSEMVNVFREIRRVLRDDGTVWLNLGDSYAGSWGAQGRPQGNGEMSGRSVASARQIASHPRFTGKTGTRGAEIGLKPKDLMGIPWRVAFALQADGWWLRQDNIWNKPNPMPESVTDRFCKSHEYVFLLTKSADYFFDYIAAQEPVSGTAHSRGNGINPKAAANSEGCRQNESFSGAINGMVEKRNKRSVWTVSTQPYKGAHFATFPPDLIRPCIMAGTSEHGCCPECGSPWERVIESVRVATRPGKNTKVKVPSGWDTNTGSHGSIHKEGRRSSDEVGNRDPERHVTTTKTIGWQPTCECGLPDTGNIPCTVLDPFNGSGTTGQVARECGCHYIGCELNPEYVELTKKRLQQNSLLV